MNKLLKNENNYPLSPDKYREILHTIELNNIYLIESKTKLDVEFLTEAPALIKISQDYNYEIKDENSVIVLCSILLESNCVKIKKKFLSIKADFNIFLEHKSNFTDDFFVIYKEFSLPIIIWPFFREFAYSITSRMNIPPLVLPMIKQ